MSQELVISSNPIETTVAVVEDDRLVEIYVEHHARKALVGSIYKGRVTRVLPGMQSAFVNLGLQRDAFLYVTDVLEPPSDIEDELDSGPIEAEPIQALPAGEEPLPDGGADDGGPDQEEAGEASEDSEADEAGAAPRSRRRRRRRRRRSGRADDRDEGQDGAAPEPDASRASEEGGGAEAQPAVLPGESLAKFRGKSRIADDARADEAPGTDAAEPAEPAVAELGTTVPGAPAETSADAAEPPATDGTEAGSQDDSGADGPSVSEEEPAAEPPRQSASVAGPTMIAELRIGLLGWLKRKMDPGEKAPPQEADEARPKRGKRGPARKRGAASQPAPKREGRPVPGQPAEEPKKRAGRRPVQSRRSKDGRGRSGARGGGRRDSLPQRDQQPSPQANIDDLLKSGQEVLVQVNKEPVGAKGARITSHVSLPGRYMVYMTTAKHSGISRKIQPESERNRLRRIIDEHSEGKPGGFVVRSAARGVDEADLVADIDFLHKLWSSLQEKASRRKAPAKLHSDLDIVERVLRDSPAGSYKAVWVDSEVEFERIMRFVERFQPDMASRVKLYTRPQPIYDSFGITKGLEKALKPKVRLPSGGYIVINQTEALVAIDVNTGRYVGKSNRLEDTVLKTNLEAAEEIVRQLRLRDLGGIIVIDFIDMEDRKNRQAVHQVLQDALKNTRSPSRLLPFNDFGLIVITRKSVRQSLERALCMPCPACNGAGTVKSSATVMSEIFSAADRVAASIAKSGGDKSKDLTLRVHPEIAKSLKRKSNSHLEELEAAVGSTVVVRSDSSMHPENFTLD